MSKIKKAIKLSALIVSFGKGAISKDRADLLAFRYYSNDNTGLFSKNHIIMRQLANNLALAEMMKEGQYNEDISKKEA